MAESSNPLIALSDHTAQIVERAAQSVVAVHGAGRSSGIHWRAGVIVTAEEALERDDDISVTLAGGRQVSATLAGRDPSTDVAVLRFQPDGLAPAHTAAATDLRPGHIVLAVGSHDGAPVASLGIVGFAGGVWHSSHGGAIDRLLRLDLALSPVGEGGALVDVEGRVLGMTVFGPRRRVLAIPASTIDRAVDQILSKGHVARGYLGAGLQNVRLGRGTPAAKRGILVVSIDPAGPATRSGLLVGDIITAWNTEPVAHVREVMRRLGSDSVGTSVDLQLLRGGAAASLQITIGERPLS
jgi:S1-C subfamily serine protease